jgi:hypothetical protein
LERLAKIVEICSFKLSLLSAEPNQDEGGAKRRRNEAGHDNLLTDDGFVQLKKEKADLENQLLRRQVEHQDERHHLEVQLLQAQIAELHSRASFFKALTASIEKGEAASNLLGLASRSFQPEA